MPLFRRNKKQKQPLEQPQPPSSASPQGRQPLYRQPIDIPSEARKVEGQKKHHREQVRRLHEERRLLDDLNAKRRR